LEDREKIRNTLIAVAVLYGLPFLVDPGWFGDWMASSPGFLDYASHSSSLFGIGRLVPLSWAASTAVVAVAGIAVFAIEFRSGRLLERYWEYVTLFNPLAHEYSLSMLYRLVDWFTVAISWVAIVLRFAVGSGLPMTVIPIYLLLKRRFGAARESRLRT
jgi:hypothetical protein